MVEAGGERSESEVNGYKTMIDVMNEVLAGRVVLNTEHPIPWAWSNYAVSFGANVST